MNSSQAVMVILVATVFTMLTRFLPFLIFGKNKETPPYISYLGRVLPYAIMGMLVVYCLKGTSFLALSGWAPSAIAVVAVVLLHVWKRNSLLSILGGTVIYMILLRLPIFM